MIRLFTFVAIVMLCTGAHAEERTFRFPEQMCAITLPESSEWRVLSRELINDPEMILVALASDGKVSANLSVVELALANENEAKEVVDFQVAGMKAAGLEVTNIQKRDFVKVPGWWITSKGPVKGNDTVQITWTIFANDRVYMITGSMIGKDLTESEAKRATAVLMGIEINTKTQSDAEPTGAAQPATKPADKPPVKDRPSTPTPKDAPR
jgi:hypothetical protein